MATNISMLSSPHPDAVSTLSTEALRRWFVIEKIFSGGDVNWTFTDLDRMAVGGAQPTIGNSLNLENHKQTGAEFFLQRRELGLINVGGPGRIRADGKDFALNNLDCLYISTGTKSVTVESNDDAKPAKFLMMSCPSHHAHPTAIMRKEECKPIALGSQATANQRKIYQYIHAGGIKSSQLVMGFTELAEGSVWNTMPPHTHLRRMEAYFYFDMGDNVVSHFLGAPQQTRHVFMHNDQAVLSPPWSIHCGCGTGAYKFIWAMAGENQTFDDMDKVALGDLR